MKCFIYLMLSIACLNLLFPGNYQDKLNQRKGIWQEKKEKQIEFISFSQIDFSFDKVPLKMVEKISLHKNKLFILDGKRDEIYVINKKGEYLYSIGKRGQGPGELANGTDFFISPEDKIYVLSSGSRRIEMFTLDGKYLGSIRLDANMLIMNPCSLIVDINKNIYVSSSYEHLVTKYSPKGSFISLIMERSQAVDYRKAGGKTMGVPARLGFLEEKIVHFDIFKGIFTILTPSGSKEMSFSAFSQISDELVKNVLGHFRKKSNIGGRQVSIFRLWNNFCIDHLNNIYAVPKRRKSESQVMFVFSKNGDFLYQKTLEYFNKKNVSIREMCCDDDYFVFGTYNWDLFLAKIK
jgi:hypothetical protein